MNTTTEIDFNSLRLAPSYGASLGVKKLLTTVPVGKPVKSKFFRVHPSPEMVFLCLLLEQKDIRETYAVLPGVAQELSALVVPVQLNVGIDRQNNLFLIPTPLPKEDGTRNPWHESLAQATELAKSKWIRLASNMAVGAYDLYEAEGLLPEPEWPEYGIEEIVQVAFRGKIVNSPEHPIVQALMGRV